MTHLSGESGTSPATLPSVSVELGSLMNLTVGTRRRQQRGRCARAGAEPVLLDPDPRRVVLEPLAERDSHADPSARTPQPTTSTVPGR